jgi:hypothetical protein
MQLVLVTHRCSLPAREGPSERHQLRPGDQHRYRDRHRAGDPAVTASKQCRAHLAKPLLHDLPHLPPNLLAPREADYRGSAQPDTETLTTSRVRLTHVYILVPDELFAHIDVPADQRSRRAGETVPLQDRGDETGMRHFVLCPCPQRLSNGTTRMIKEKLGSLVQAKRTWPLTAVSLETASKSWHFL